MEFVQSLINVISEFPVEILSISAVAALIGFISRKNNAVSPKELKKALNDFREENAEAFNDLNSTIYELSVKIGNGFALQRDELAKQIAAQHQHSASTVQEDEDQDATASYVNKRLGETPLSQEALQAMKSLVYKEADLFVADIAARAVNNPQSLYELCEVALNADSYGASKRALDSLCELSSEPIERSVYQHVRNYLRQIADKLDEELAEYAQLIGSEFEHALRSANSQDTADPAVVESVVNNANLAAANEHYFSLADNPFATLAHEVIDNTCPATIRKKLEKISDCADVGNEDAVLALARVAVNARYAFTSEIAMQVLERNARYFKERKERDVILVALGFVEDIRKDVPANVRVARRVRNAYL